MLPRLLDLPERDPLEQCQGGRCGKGKGSVRTVEMSGSLIELSAADGFDLQESKSRTGTDNIGDGVHGTHFMKAHRIRRNPVDGSLSLGDTSKDGKSPLPDLGFEGATLEQVADFRVGATMRMLLIVRVGMPVAVWVLVSISLNMGVSMSDSLIGV